MFHRQLERQIRKYLGPDVVPDEKLQQLLKAVSDSYVNFERDKEFNEHLFKINDTEYNSLNTQLRQLTASLEHQVQDRIREIEDLARFPMENPNPIIRVDLTGKILFVNPSTRILGLIEYEGLSYSLPDFFKMIVHKIDGIGSIDFLSGTRQFLLFHRVVDERKYINFYGIDVTEKNQLRRAAQENYDRLHNFLESTDDAYYIVYGNHREKNIITSKWMEFFGFDGNASADLFVERSHNVLSMSSNDHMKLIHALKIGEKLSVRYQVNNPKTSKQFWLSEIIGKHYDTELDDVYISGRITNVTNEEYFAMKIRESEKRFRNLMDAVPFMVWVSDETNLVNYTNSVMKNFLGYEMEDFKDGKRFNEKVHPDDREVAFEEWQKQIQKQLPAESSFRIKDHQDIYHHVYEKAVPRHYDDGSFAGYIGAYFDLTNEKKYQESLATEKAKLELITRNSPDIVLLTDANGKIEYVSPTVKRLLGFSEKECLGHYLQEFLCDECQEQLTSMQWLQNLKSRNEYDYRMKTKSGKLIWVESIIRIVHDELGEGYKLLMHNRDINNIKLAEAVAKEKEQKYRKLFENMQLGVMEVDIDERIQWVNRAFEQMSGYSMRYLKGKSPSQLFIVKEADQKRIDDVHEIRKKGGESIYEVDFKNKKGDVLNVVISGSPVMNMEGEVIGSVGIHWDVTQIRYMEKRIEEEKILRQKEVMQATLKAEEQQREIIGNELHDGVGHILTYTSLFLQMAAAEENISPALIEKAKDKVELAIQEVRRISRNLVPPALIDLGLREAIIELLNQYAGVRAVKFELECKKLSLAGIDLNAQRNIYRIVQELIHNTMKHTEADHISLSITRNESNMQIDFRNNGVAFDVERLKKGVGLQSIHNRAYFYNGNLSVISKKNEGTSFHIELPLKNLLNHD
jgi:PAS domain S-box-containing protein